MALQKKFRKCWQNSVRKGCGIIGRWRKACVSHFYSAVASTQEHLGELKLAKFEAFLSHVINKHRNLPSRLFSAICARGEIAAPHVWMTKASQAYEKLCTELGKTSLIKAIKQASSVEQKVIIQISLPLRCLLSLFLDYLADYVADIFESLTTTPKADLKSMAELKQEVPEPLHTNVGWKGK